MRRQKLTLERHKELGRYFSRLQEEIGDLLCEVSHAEGKTTPTRTLEKIYSLLARLRSQMETVLFRDYPKEGDIRIYFPGDAIDEQSIEIFEQFIQTLDLGDKS